MIFRILSLFFVTFLVGCLPNGQLTINVANQAKTNELLSVTLNQSISESVGPCTFLASLDPVNASGFSYRVTFSEPVDPSTFQINDITNIGTGGTSSLLWSLSDCGDNQNFKLSAASVVGDGTIRPSIARGSVTNFEGLQNNASTSTDNSITFDSISPTVTINQSINETIGSCTFQSVADPSSTAGFSYKVSFSEIINASTFTVSDILNAGAGGSSALDWNLSNCGDNKNFKLTATTVTGNGTIIPTLPAGRVNDIAANASAASTSTDGSVTFSVIGFFTATIEQAISETIGSCVFTPAADPINAAGFSYRVRFGGPINSSSFSTTDILNTGTGGNTSLIWAMTNCGDDTNFKLTATTVNGNGTIIPTLASNSVQNLSGDNNSSSTSTDNSIIFDTTSPTVTINQSTAQTIGTCIFSGTTDPASAVGFSYRITFSEPISSGTLTTGDISNSGTGGGSGITWAIANCGDNTHFKLTASTVSGTGTIIPGLASSAVQDLAGNNSIASTSTDNTITFDNVSPTVTINQAINETIGTCGFTATSDPSNSSAAYRINFSEAIDATTLTAADIVNAGSGGSVSLNWTITNCGDNRNFKLEAYAISPNGSIIPNINAGSVIDAAGNSNLLSTATDNTITFDTSSPSVTINQSVLETVGSCSFTATTDPSTIVGFNYRVTFSESIIATEFTNADIVNSGTGGATALSWTINSCGDNRNFKVIATAITGDGTITPNITLGSVQDLAGNTNTASTSTDNTVTFDQTIPSVTVNQASTETIGSCSFTSYLDPVSSSGFSYRIRFSERIDTATFNTTDITNSGTGGATLLTWTLSNCGDDTNFKLTASAVTGNGTIVPSIAVGTVKDLVGNNNSASTSTDNTVTYNGGSGWFQEAYIKASNAEASDNFGAVVHLSGDTMAVSAPKESSNQTTITNGTSSSSDNSFSEAGAVYVYKRTGATWVQEAYLKASNAGDFDRFGSALAIHGDTLVVGTPYDDSNQNVITNGPTASSDNSNGGGGSAFVFKRTGSTWIQEAYLKPSNANPESSDQDENFGAAVTINGNTIAVGAPAEASNQTTINNGGTVTNNQSAYGTGAVYVFTRSGSIWSQESYIKPSTTEYYFGQSVSMSGNSLAVSIVDGVYIFNRLGRVWYEESFIKASNTEEGDFFGFSLSYSGNTLAITAPYEDSNLTTITNGTATSSDNTKEDSGATYIYRRNGILWSQEAYIKTSNSDSFDLAGYGVALSGNTLAISSTHEGSNQTTITNDATSSTNNTNNGSGAIYVYLRNGTTWTQEAYIKAVNNNIDDGFGTSISLSGDTLVVGASNEDSAITTITNGATASSNNMAIDSGAVYVYRNLSRLFELGEVSFSVTENSITANWLKVNGANNYLISYQAGLIPPATCAGGISAGDVNTYIIPSLSADTAYSIRICASNGLSTTDGLSYVVSTKDIISPVSAVIAKAVNETIGTCNFVTAIEPAFEAGFSYKVSFGEAINKSSFTRDDISNAGSIPNSDIHWSIFDCGDGLNFMIKAMAVSSTGTIVPSIGSSSFTDFWGNSNTTTSNAPASFDFTMTGWYQEAYIKASNSNIYHRFGNLSLSGDTLVVSSENEHSNQTTITNGTTSSTNESAAQAGAAYVYKRSGTIWSQEAYIKASNARANNYFGSSVDIFQDTLVVGSRGENSNFTTITNGTTSSSNTLAQYSGAAYVYKRSGSTWTQEAYIKSSNNRSQNQFGLSVSLDHNTIAVGSLDDSNQTTITNGTTSSMDTFNNESGSVFIYKRTGASWVQEAYIKAPNNESGDHFGTGLSLHQDTLAVSSYEENSSQNTITNGPGASFDSSHMKSGAAYIFRRTNSLWAQEAYIKASNNDEFDRYGTSVALDANSLAVASVWEGSNQTTITNGPTASDDNSLWISGAVYVYKRTGSTWVQEAYIKAANNDHNLEFGSSVDINGETLAIGAIGDASEQTKITNGDLANTDDEIYYAGAVYVYKKTGTAWKLEAFIKASNNAESNYFGSHVAISGDTIAVGANGESSNQRSITIGPSSSTDTSLPAAGAVYIYRNRSRVFEVDHLSAVPLTNGVILKWQMSKGNAIGYQIAYKPGPIPPDSCQTDTIISTVTGTETITGLIPLTTYSFRVCATNVATFSNGETISVTTP